MSALTAICPVDGRYARQTEPLRSICSEYGLIRNRVRVELEWIRAMASCPEIDDVPMLSEEANREITQMTESFSVGDAQRVKDIEKVTNHDVKAVEYFLKEKFDESTHLQNSAPFLHFACTSEDINNLSYALMLRDAKEHVLLPMMGSLIDLLSQKSHELASVPMLSRTHGQTASPTTVGKEFANVVYRLKRQRDQVQSTTILGKFNGAVGNFNAHMVAYPHVPWTEVSQRFVQDALQITYNPYTTQIEPHDYIAEMFDGVARFNTVLLDFCRDMWTYISLGYFKQKAVEGEIGSSTMPHKVNPIDFENAEGNLGMGNAIFQHMGAKLPVSRMQRDLSDSTVLRSIGTGMAYSVIAYTSVQKGLGRVDLNRDRVQEDLQSKWELLAEPIQTLMRRHHVENAYEQLKDMTRGKEVTESAVREFIHTLDLPKSDKQRLLQLTPLNYTGLAESLARAIE